MTRWLDPTLVSRRWCGIIDLNRSILNLLMSDIYHPKKSMEVIQHSNPETGEGGGVSYCPNATSSARFREGWFCARLFINEDVIESCHGPRKSVYPGSTTSSNWAEFDRLGARGCWISLVAKRWNHLPASLFRYLTESLRRAWLGCGRWLLMGYLDFHHAFGSYVSAPCRNPKFFTLEVDLACFTVLYCARTYCTSYDDKSIGYLEVILFLLF